MICDYNFYTNDYKGTVFTAEGDFNRYEIRAELILNKYIDPNAEPSYNLKMCCCAIAETIFKFEDTEDKILRGIYSEKVSGYSVSYGSSSERLVNYRSKIEDLIALWLDDEIVNRNASYRGVSRHVL